MEASGSSEPRRTERASPRSPASRAADPNAAEGGTSRVRGILAISGPVYLVWWFAVEWLLPGAFNPLPSRLAVVGLSAVLLGSSYRNRWVERHVSALFTGWACLLVAHYCYLLIGNHGDSTWWVGAFVTFAAASMCLQSRREVAAFSSFSFVGVLYAAAVEGNCVIRFTCPDWQRFCSWRI